LFEMVQSIIRRVISRPRRRNSLGPCVRRRLPGRRVPGGRGRVPAFLDLSTRAFRSSGAPGFKCFEPREGFGETRGVPAIRHVLNREMVPKGRPYGSAWDECRRSARRRRFSCDCALAFKASRETWRRHGSSTQPARPPRPPLVLERWPET